MTTAARFCEVAPFDHRKVRGAVPPAGARFTAPVKPPKQVTSVLVKTSESAAGWVKMADVEAVQPFASVTVTVKAPALRPLKSSVVAPFDHKKLWGNAPPDVVKLILPLAKPLQLGLVETAAKAKTGGWSIVKNFTTEQPLASVTVTVKLPAPRPLKSSVVAPFDHKKDSTPVPPVAVRLIAPVWFPLQSTFVTVPEREIAAGCETVAPAKAVQPFASVTVT